MHRIMTRTQVALVTALVAVGALVSTAPAAEAGHALGEPVICIGYSFPPTVYVCGWR